MPRDTLETTPAERTLLAYVNDQEQGLRRLAHGKGFSYVDEDGRTVKDEATLARIKALAIPPAWTSVWICPDPNGHIQAIGRDQKNRKQYRYHPDWRADRDARKYDRMAAFGRALPKLRKRVAVDLARRGLPREKVLAAVVSLLELTLIRVGNDEYAKTNKSFGLTTMRKRHLKLASGGAVFEFVDFSAKDFRTWYGSLAALEALSMSPKPATQTEAKRTLNTCVKAVAGLLGNTPAVCRAAYIHPKVLEAFEASQLPKRRASSPRAKELTLLKLVAA
jgi:DNA topoisomerase-1